MRLDAVLAQRSLCRSRSQAQRLINEGKVRIDGDVVMKPSFEYTEGNIEVVADRFVSRAGDKLDAALDVFGINVEGLTALDIGASTGGFTDCLLSRAVKFVYAVDVGTMQLDGRLRCDRRVCVMENTNARTLSKKSFPERIDIAVMDVSFISQTLIFDAVADILSEGGTLVSLIKPQFEVGRAHIGKGGVVKEEKYRLEAVRNVCDAALKRGFVTRATCVSPITGGDGNVEYLAHFQLER